jgi:hypothetical protein
MLAEALALASVAGATGLLVAWSGVKALMAIAPPDLPRADEIGLNVAVLLFALGVTALTILLFGLAPAWRIARVNLNDALREGSRGLAGSMSDRRVRASLVVMECALAIVLLAGAPACCCARLRAWPPSNLGFEPKEC